MTVEIQHTCPLQDMSSLLLVSKGKRNRLFIGKNAPPKAIEERIIAFLIPSFFWARICRPEDINQYYRYIKVDVLEKTVLAIKR